MALDANARKTEHNGAKNMGHCKSSPRQELKDASKKLRRRADRNVVEDDVAAMPSDAFLKIEEGLEEAIEWVRQNRIKAD